MVNSKNQTNQTTAEIKEVSQGKTKKVIKQSVAPFILGGVATAAATYFMKGERRNQLQEGLVNAKNQAKDMAQKGPIANKIKENLDNETPIAEAIKKTVTEQKDEMKNQNQNQDKNKVNENPAKDSETGGF